MKDSTIIGVLYSHSHGEVVGDSEIEKQIALRAQKDIEEQIRQERLKHEQREQAEMTSAYSRVIQSSAMSQMFTSGTSQFRNLTPFTSGISQFRNVIYPHTYSLPKISQQRNVDTQRRNQFKNLVFIDDESS